ncbi:MAG: hypothetical protein R3A43_01865 [Bacteroidia bacterium]
MNAAISEYNHKQTAEDKAICHLLEAIISTELPEAQNKIWHAQGILSLSDE